MNINILKNGERNVRNHFCKDQEGILERYHENRIFWEEHLAHSKQYIIESFKNKPFQTAVILGSGWLLDVPLPEMENHFSEITFVDIVHPLIIKKKFSRSSKVKFITTDLTGGLAAKIMGDLSRKKNHKKFSLNSIEIPDFPDFSNFDFVVSLNLLNQLNILIEDYILEFYSFSKAELEEFAYRIQEKHLTSLPENRSCIITDYEEIYFKNQQEIKREPLIFIPFGQYKNISYWDWKFDMNGMYREGYNTIFNVVAFLK